MKLIYKIIPAILLGCLLLVSCNKKFLDQVPDDRVTIDQVFKQRRTTEAYLAQVYRYVSDQFNQRFVYPWTGGSDEVKYVFTFSPSQIINNGSISSSTGFVIDFWSDLYKGIRSATYFLQHADECVEILNDGPQGRKLLDRYKAEARTLRASYYLRLLQIYGPVVLLGDAIVAPDAPVSELQFERNTVDEFADFISSEIDKAVPDLLLVPGSVDYGRVTQGFAKGIKARTLLLAASPQFNGNTALTMQKKNGTYLVNQQKDVTKWKKAADAAKAVIDMNVYSLYYNTGTFNPVTSCREVMYQNWNKEWIFARIDNAASFWEYDCTPWLSQTTNIGGAGAAGVTQAMIDAYFMANGKGINDPGSGYVNSGFSNSKVTYGPAAYDNVPAGTHMMYLNREPRFYAQVTYNGSTWINTTKGNMTVELQYSGNSGKSKSATNYSPTGTVCRKNVLPDQNNSFSSVARPLVLMRLAEMYLSYVEALNEYDPGNSDILLYLNAIRKRAGIPEYGSSTLPAPTNQSDMREAIRRERRVELAFESFRFFDIRRWLIAEQLLNGPIYGCNPDKGNSVSDPEFYVKKIIENRVWLPRHNLFPLPQLELNKDKALVQNTGW